MRYPWFGIATTAPRSPRFGLATLALLLSCRSVLGIEDPEPGAPDASAFDADRATDDATSDRITPALPDAMDERAASVEAGRDVSDEGSAADTGAGDAPSGKPRWRVAGDSISLSQFQEETSGMRDTYTGLLWPSSDLSGRSSYDQAVKDCKGFGRVPSVVELLSIVDYTKSDPSVPSGLFRVFDSRIHFSETPAALDSTSVWGVSFARGAAQPVAKDDGLGQYTVCVAGERLDGSSPSRFEVNGENVIDHDTGLVWKRSLAGPVTYADAVATCRSGALPFRVPTFRELISIVDFSRAYPALDPAVFHGTTDAVLWSTTPLSVSTSGLLLALDLQYGGDVSLDPKLAKVSVRCVRTAQ